MKHLILVLLLASISTVVNAEWFPVSKAQMSKLSGFPARATLGSYSTEKASLFVFCGEGVMLSFPNRNSEEINTIEVDGRALKINQRVASMTVVEGVVGAFKKGNSVRISGTNGSTFDFSLIGFTKARAESC